MHIPQSFENCCLDSLSQIVQLLLWSMSFFLRCMSSTNSRTSDGVPLFSAASPGSASQRLTPRGHLPLALQYSCSLFGVVSQARTLANCCLQDTRGGRRRGALRSVEEARIRAGDLSALFEPPTSFLCYRLSCFTESRPRYDGVNSSYHCALRK